MHMLDRLPYFQCQGFHTQQQLLLLTPEQIDMLDLNLAEKLTLKEYVTHH